MSKKIKDPKKVAAGRKGGKKSSGNFKHDREKAVLAGQRSAWIRSKGKLKDYPVPFVDETGKEYAVKDPEAADAAGRRQR